MEVRILFIEGCPNVDLAERRVREAVADRRDVTVVRQLVHDEHEAALCGMHGSPTILVDGIDPFAAPDHPTSWACRVFLSPDGAAGAPSVQQLRDAL